MIANTTSLTTEYADTMSLVNHHRTIVLVFQFDDFRQFSQVTFHGEYTIHYDKLNGFVR